MVVLQHEAAKFQIDRKRLKFWAGRTLIFNQTHNRWFLLCTSKNSYDSSDDSWWPVKNPYDNLDGSWWPMEILMIIGCDE